MVKAKTNVTYPEEVLLPIKKHLEDKLVQLKEREAELSKADPFSDESRLNDNAAADIEATEQFDHARIEAMRGETTAAIESALHALRKIEDKMYGACEECDEMIDTDRLGIDPTARLCVKCQQKQTE